MVDILEEQFLVVDVVGDVGIDVFFGSMFEEEVSGLEFFGSVEEECSEGGIFVSPCSQTLEEQTDQGFEVVYICVLFPILLDTAKDETFLNPRWMSRVGRYVQIQV